MNRRHVLTGLVLGIALQAIVLGGIVAHAALPLWTGTEIQVRTLPVDPRSLFRGNYALLRYDFSRVPVSMIPGAENLRHDDLVYVSLRQGSSGLHEMEAVLLQEPQSGIFLRGRVRSTVTNRMRPNRQADEIRLEFGIEAFFAPKEEALRLERELRQSGTAVLMVAGNGRAALKDVVPADATGEALRQ